MPPALIFLIIILILDQSPTLLLFPILILALFMFVILGDWY